MSTLSSANLTQPLAERLRPNKLEQIVGQDHLLNATGPIGRMLNQKRIASMVLWGPPGCGKTTLARLMSDQVKLEFEPLSAVFSGVSDLRKIFDKATKRKELGQGTLLFIDEIHRFNKSQQDSFLPYVEDGTVVLVGATTENPSFELNSALLSRCQVYVMRRMDDNALEIILKRAEDGEKRPLPINEACRPILKAMADGDGRFLLNMVEELFCLPPDVLLDVTDLAGAINNRAPIFDKNGDQHYNLISALHKSLRGSDVDAALYWLARMLIGGEDKAYLLRRLTRFASEDIGLADPTALSHSLACWDAYNRLGSPEGDLSIAQCVIYLATAPKSNAGHKALTSATNRAQRTGSLKPPNHILNAPTALMKDLGYGAGYNYDHNTKDSFSGQSYFPKELKRERFYQPNERGFEREILKRISYWDKLRENIKD
jgi:putative ATPase